MVGVSSDHQEPTSYLGVCTYCGTPIEEPDTDCPALDDGRCRP